MTILHERKFKFLEQLFKLYPKISYTEIYDAADRQNLKIAANEISEFKRTHGPTVRNHSKNDKQKKDDFLLSYLADVNQDATNTELLNAASKQGIHLDSLSIAKIRKSLGVKKRRSKEECDKITNFVRTHLNFKSIVLISLIKTELGMEISRSELSVYKQKAKKSFSSTTQTQQTVSKEPEFGRIMEFLTTEKTTLETIQNIKDQKENSHSQWPISTLNYQKNKLMKLLNLNSAQNTTSTTYSRQC